MRLTIRVVQYKGRREAKVSLKKFAKVSDNSPLRSLSAKKAAVKSKRGRTSKFLSSKCLVKDIFFSFSIYEHGFTAQGLIFGNKIDASWYRQS